MDVAKVDRDVAHVAYFANVSEVCCKRLFKMIHLFHTYVVPSALFGCCIYFTHMLQVFYLDIAYVLHTCCNIMFQMFNLCQTYVASWCFILQVFHEDMVNDGCTTWAPGDGA
jgi:hypothetical protein